MPQARILADLHAVEVGQADIQDDGLVRAVHDPLHGFQTAVDRIDGVAFGCQSAPDNAFVVLHQQHPLVAGYRKGFGDGCLDLVHVLVLVHGQLFCVCLFLKKPAAGLP